MFINREFSEGVAAVADEAMTSGMAVVLTQNTDGKMHAKKVSAAGDLTGRIGIAYVDHNKKVNQYPVSSNNANLTNSTEYEAIAQNEIITVLYGRGRGMMNQLVDGFYNAGDKLTIDTTSARFKPATTSTDRVFGRISLTFEGGQLASQNRLVEASFLIGGVGAQEAIP